MNQVETSVAGGSESLKKFRLGEITSIEYVEGVADEAEEIRNRELAREANFNPAQEIQGTISGRLRKLGRSSLGNT